VVEAGIEEVDTDGARIGWEIAGSVAAEAADAEGGLD